MLVLKMTITHSPVCFPFFGAVFKPPSYSTWQCPFIKAAAVRRPLTMLRRQRLEPEEAVTMS